MNITRYRNTLIAAAVAVSLGAGVTACSQSPEDSSADARSTTADEATSDNPRGGTLSGSGTSSGTGTSSGSGTYGSGTSSGSGAVAGSGTGSGSTYGSGTSSGTGTSSGSTYGSGTSSGTGSGSAYGSGTSGSTSAMANAAEDGQDAMSDAGITTKVKGLLLADSDAKGFDVDVETRDGVVMLQGSLKDQKAVDHVKQIAEGVEGVKSVNATELTIDSKR